MANTSDPGHTLPDDVWAEVEKQAQELEAEWAKGAQPVETEEGDD